MNDSNNIRINLKSLIIGVFLIVIITAIPSIVWAIVEKNNEEGSSQITVHDRVETFNRQFEEYAKKQSGTDIGKLMVTLIANCNSNKDVEDKLPDLVVETNEGIGGYVVSKAIIDNDDSTKQNTNVVGFTRIKELLEKDHNYYVTLKYDAKGYADLIIIEYYKGDFNHISEEQYRDVNTKELKDLSVFGGTSFAKDNKQSSSMNSLNNKSKINAIYIIGIVVVVVSFIVVIIKKKK